MRSRSTHRRARATCALCPKLCRFACPVAEATANEALTPNGKMSLALLAQSGTRRYDEHAGAAVYACTSCLRCRTWCRHELDVGAALLDARGDAAEEGEAPHAVDRIKERFAAAGNPFGVSLEPTVRALARETEGKAYFPGCTAIHHDPMMVHGAIDAAAGFGLRLALSGASSVCCGYPLWAAGLRSEFEHHARQFAAKVRDLDELVIGDPGCAWTLLQAYAEAGIELGPKIVLLVDLLAERVEYAFGRAPLGWQVAYHDSCILGRRLGRYDGPRRLLRAAVGEFFEAPENREDAGCSGGGGLLPLTMPDVSLRIAAARAAELGAPARKIVAACPTACRNFRKAGADAVDLFTVLARWIAHEEDESPRG